jgi:putative transcriptional regulator
MTRLGEYLAKRMVNRAGVSRKTGISKTRMNELANNKSTLLRADELYMIALAIEVNPCELLEFVCGHINLDSKEEKAP